MRIGLLHVHYTQACTHACMQFARWTMAKFWNFPSFISRLGFIALNANIAPFAIQLLWQTSATITIKGRKQINSEQCVCNVCFIISTEYSHSLSTINSIMKEGTERHLKKKWAKNESPTIWAILVVLLTKHTVKYEYFITRWIFSLFLGVSFYRCLLIITHCQSNTPYWKKKTWK